MQDFNFYKVNETLNHKYYQIPQELFINPLYKNTLNSDNAFDKYITSKGFDLERGMFVEDTNRNHYTIAEYKQIINYKNTKKILNNIKLQLPDTPDITDIKINRLSKKRDEIILEKIIKPKDDLIKELHTENLSLHKELSKQSKVTNEAEKYQSERDFIIADNKTLNNRVKELENDYKIKSKNLDFDYKNRKDELEKEFRNKKFNIEYKYKHQIKTLEKENSYLHKIIDKFYETIEKSIDWICQKFGIGESKELIKKFQEDTHTFIDPKKELKYEEQLEKEWELER